MAGVTRITPATFIQNVEIEVPAINAQPRPGRKPRRQPMVGQTQCLHAGYTRSTKAGA